MQSLLVFIVSILAMIGALVLASWLAIATKNVIVWIVWAINDRVRELEEENARLRTELKISQLTNILEPKE